MFTGFSLVSLVGAAKLVHMVPMMSGIGFGHISRPRRNGVRALAGSEPPVMQQQGKQSMKLGIIGAGNIGATLAPKLAASGGGLGCHRSTSR
jgi:phosphoglycerate dehydrogenase-like enzyme